MLQLQKFLAEFAKIQVVIMLDFLSLHFIDIIDILLVALLVFYVYRLIRGTAAMSIFIAIILLYFIWLLVRALKMELLNAIMGQVLGVGVIAIIIIFQQEIRRFLLHLGQNVGSKRRNNFITRTLFGSKGEAVTTRTLDELTQAVSRMVSSKTGALIVMTHLSSLDAIIETGDRIDSNVNRRLIENIFFKNSPLHDGALIMNTNRLIAARCTLPMSDSQNIPAHYGMRHRAAVGVTEQTDATAIVVSEETGGISFVKEGVLKSVGSIAELRLAIEDSYKS